MYILPVVVVSITKLKSKNNLIPKMDRSKNFLSSISSILVFFLEILRESVKGNLLSDREH